MASSPFTPWRRIVRDYFTFAKWQRRSLIVIWLAISSLIVVKLATASRDGQTLPVSEDVWLTAVTELKTMEDSLGRRASYDEAPRDWVRESQDPKPDYKAALLHPFPFDPNTVSAPMLARMGLREKAIQNLLKYRASGAKFRVPEDLGKLYSLRPEESAQLIPFVTIAAGTQTIQKDSARAFPPIPNRYPAKANMLIDINTADTNSWKALPGIGSKLSARIVKFREKLGGFHSIDQVAETFGLPDSTFRNIRQRLQLADASALDKINLNTADAATLKAHPYMSWALANAIVQYRAQHGAFTNLNDLLKIHLANEAWLAKMKPYLSLN